MLPPADLATRLEAAFTAPSARAYLQRLMAELMEKGLERDQIFTALETFHSQLTAQGRAEDADLILEIIDGFTGWCAVE